MKTKVTTQKQMYKDMFNDLLKELEKEYENDYIIKEINIKNSVDGAYIIVTICKPSENKTIYWQFLEKPITIIYKYNEEFKLVKV